jgi:hypothetical protein
MQLVEVLNDETESCAPADGLPPPRMSNVEYQLSSKLSDRNVSRSTYVRVYLFDLAFQGSSLKPSLLIDQTY